MTARKATENDVLGDREEHRSLGPTWLAWGVIGWDGDKTGDDALELGDGTIGATGATLIHVTLFSGRDLTKRPEKGKAQGRQIRAQLEWSLALLPPLGTAVVVAFPDGDDETPGNGIVFFRALGGLKAPNWKSGDAALCALSGYGNFIRVRTDGRIELSTRTNDGNNADVYSLIDPIGAGGGLPGFYDVAPWGTQIFNASGWHLQTQWGASVDFGGWSDGGLLSSLGFTSTIRFRSSSFTAAAATVKLGSGAGHQQVCIASGPLGIGATGLVPIVAAVEALTTAVTTLAAALVSGTGVDPAAQTAAATALAAVTATLTALTVTFTGAAAPLPFASFTTSAL